MALCIAVLQGDEFGGVDTERAGEHRPFDDPGIAPAQNGDNSDIGAFEAQEVLNTAPDAKDDSYSTNEDTPLTVAAPGVLTNDTDADSGDTLTATKVTDPSHGTLSLNPNGSFTYTPAANYNTTAATPDTFTYKASDGKGGEDTATVTITVTPVNDAPKVEVAAGFSCDTSTKGTMNLTVADVDSRWPP